MKDRGLRRHHEQRIRERFREVAQRWAGKYDSWAQKWEHKWENGKLVSREHKIDNRGYVQRLSWIERTMRLLAHHNKCPCGMCKRERYRRDRFDPQKELRDGEDQGPDEM
jgi:transposase-like protein